MKQEKLDALLEQIRNASDPPNIISDGIVDYDRFEKAAHRILWVLKEPNDKNRTEWDLRKFLKDVTIYPKWRRTYKKIIQTSYGILNDVRDYSKIPAEYSIKDILHEIAQINIKKVGGPPTSYWKNIRDTYQKDKSLILEQIDIIDPEILINCSRVYELTEDLSSLKPNLKIIDSYHPAARVSAQFFFSEIMDKL
jgi:hypothetical protein